MQRYPTPLLAAALLFLSAPAYAQTALERSIIAAGGHEISGPTYSVRSTFGQPAVGAVSGATYGVQLGYQHGPLTIPTAIPDTDLLAPKHYRLDQNFPNPFNPTTTIAFDLPRAGRVSLDVFDVRGRIVVRLIERDMNAGRHKTEFDASNIASGVYFYRLQAGDFEQTRKLILMK